MAGLSLSRLLRDFPDITVNKVDVAPVDLKSRLGLAPDDRIVVFQGWLSERRGLEKLVDAARNFSPGVRLFLIGYGYYQPALERMARDAGIEDRVIFYGEVPYEEMLPLLAGADLGIIPYYGIDPNTRFCSPNKLFEFVMAGLPFIANDLPFLRTMVDRYGIGRLGDLTTAAGMAEMINAVLADEPGLERIKRCAAAAREELNWDIEGEKLVQIYRPLGSPPEKTGSSAAPKALPR